MVHVLSSDAAQVQAEGWSPGRISAYSKGENEEVKIVITTTKPAGQWWRSTLKFHRQADVQGKLQDNQGSTEKLWKTKNQKTKQTKQ